MGPTMAPRLYCNDSSPMGKATVVGSYMSDTQALHTTVLPFSRPIANRAPTAQRKFGHTASIPVETRRPESPRSSAGRRPTRSEKMPQTGDATTWPRNITDVRELL